MDWLTAPIASVIASGLTALIGYVASRFTRNNAPDIVANDEAKKFQAAKDKINADIAKAQKTGDLSQVRKDEAQ